jgi:spectinomycin phosphotransferase
VIEPPDLSAEELLARVRSSYGVAATEAQFLPEGNDSSAWSFRLDGDGERWFLKVVAKSIAAALTIPALLAARGVPHVTGPLPTASGSLADEGEPFGLVLYPWIDGVSGGEVGLTASHRVELGRMLRAIHDAIPSPEVSAIARRERFAVRDEALIDELLAGDLPSAPDPIAERFLTAWRSHQATIARALARARDLADDARRHPHEMVICHADFHAWNVLVEPAGGFVVVDWDEALIAPRERDLMFVSGDIADLDPTGHDFYAGYGDVEVDRALLAYYRWDWVLQEVADYHRRVFDPELGDAIRAEAFDYFAGLFGPADVVAAAERADRLIPR